jgi:hypothetical protein
MSPPPPLTAAADLASQLAAAGWAVLDAATLRQVTRATPGEGSAWAGLWSDLPPDRYLRDGGRYRRRRHGSFVVSGEGFEPVAHRAHWQPVEYNALHGGLERWFEPLPDALGSDPAWAALLRGGAHIADLLRPAPAASAASAAGRPNRWCIEAHMFRIDTTDGIGRPTPEGAHRDGVDLVAVILIGRHRVKGGETRVFDARGPQGVRFTLQEPWSVLLLDDERVIHETTPIQPAEPGETGWRDTLVLTYRRNAFQGPLQGPDET